MKRKNHRWKWFARLVIAVFGVAVVLPSFFFVRVAPMHPEMWTEPVDKEVVVPVSEYWNLERNYNESMENGFCLFGYIDEDRVMVREVDLVESPAHQDAGSISFTCVQEIRDQWSRILFNSNYNFIGTAHTHPRQPYLSRPDARNLGSTWWWGSVKGIYDGNQLNFFTYGEPVNPLNLSFISLGGQYQT